MAVAACVRGAGEPSWCASGRRFEALGAEGGTVRWPRRGLAGRGPNMVRKERERDVVARGSEEEEEGNDSRVRER